MTEVVVDTNVLVSGLLTPSGSCAAIVDRIIEGNITVCYDERILEEYREVLLREKSAFSPDEVNDLLTLMRTFGRKIIPGACEESLPDEKDRPFAEVAKTSGAVLITGNLKHFSGIVPAVLPSDFEH
jgi:putative PIN family toxin of toxin-antitoxin system